MTIVLSQFKTIVQENNNNKTKQKKFSNYDWELLLEYKIRLKERDN